MRRDAARARAAAAARAVRFSSLDFNVGWGSIYVQMASASPSARREKNSEGGQSKSLAAFRITVNRSLSSMPTFSISRRVLISRNWEMMAAAGFPSTLPASM